MIAERQVPRASHHSLLALSGESEATGYRPNLKRLLSYAKAQGFDTLLDAEALAPTSKLSLRDMEGTIDAVAITFHKMFGYPSGVGALIARRDFLAKLKRLYHTMLQDDLQHGTGSRTRDSTSPFERFEVRFKLASLIHHRLSGYLSQSSSLHYQAFPAITHGIQFLDRHMPYLPQRLAALHHWLGESLSNLRYPNNSPFVRILTGLPERIAPLKAPSSFLGTTHLITPPSTPAFVSPAARSYLGSRRMASFETSSVGRSSTSCSPGALAAGGRNSYVSATPRSSLQGTYGYTITCIFLSPSGKRLPPIQMSKRAARRKIHLSTSTRYIHTPNETPCNPPHRGSSLDDRNVFDDSASDQMVVRMSLGMGSDFEDTWNVLRWARDCLEEEILEHELVSWRSASASQPHLL